MPDLDALLLELVGLLYESAENPSVWPVFLAHYAEAMHSPAVALVAQDAAGRAVIEGAHGIDSFWLREYAVRWARQNILLQKGFLQAAPGVFRNSSDCLDAAGLAGSEFYTGCLRPLELFHAGGVVVEHRESMVLFLAALRSHAAGPYTPSEAWITERLAPHIRTSGRLRRNVSALRVEVASLSAMLDGLSYGVIAADERARVLYTNRAAQQVVAARDGLIVASDGLQAANAAQHRALRQLIANVAAASGGGRPMRGSLAIWRPSGKPDYRVAVTPLAAGHDGPARGAALFITSQEQYPGPSPQSLERLLSLTPAEARLTAALASGKNLRAYCEESGISLSTARTQLKGAFAKSGVHRQADLVRLVLTSES